jgi:hypothetical protein
MKHLLSILRDQTIDPILRPILRWKLIQDFRTKRIKLNLKP